MVEKDSRTPETLRKSDLSPRRFPLLSRTSTSRCEQGVVAAGVAGNGRELLETLSGIRPVAEGCFSVGGWTWTRPTRVPRIMRDRT